MNGQGSITTPVEWVLFEPDTGQMTSIRAQTSLFSGEALRKCSPAGTDVHFVSNYLTAACADELLEILESMPGWRQDSIRVYGKNHPLPRLHRWFADSCRPYRWSGIAMIPEPFPNPLQVIRQRLEDDSGVFFNTALGNFYRNGKDSVSWHSDDEPDLGEKPIIASLSLGAARRFVLRKKVDHSKTMSFELTHGSLLWMSGTTQELWEHCVPKTGRAIGHRINLTFRAVCL